jgi:3-hydroxyisobutyrate dehydrogenase
LLSQDNPDKLIINMSTVSPETSRYLATICAARHLHFIDAPPEVSNLLRTAT